MEGGEHLASQVDALNWLRQQVYHRPEQAVVLNGALMILAGLLLSLGIAPRLAAALLIGSLVPTTLVGHPFWKEEPGPEREKQMIQFLKNFGLISGLLMVLTEKDELKA